MKKEDVEKVVGDKIRPFLEADGGNIEIVDVKDNKVYVRLQGACAGCPGAAMTLKMGVERVLRDAFPQLKELVSV